MTHPALVRISIHGQPFLLNGLRYIGIKSGREFIVVSTVQVAVGDLIQFEGESLIAESILDHGGVAKTIHTINAP